MLDYIDQRMTGFECATWRLDCPLQLCKVPRWRSDRLVGRYMLMTDLDGVCGGTQHPELSYDTNIFTEAFERASEWDAVSFVFEPYWDMWAFRQQDVHPHDHFGPSKHRNRKVNPRGG